MTTYITTQPSAHKSEVAASTEQPLSSSPFEQMRLPSREATSPHGYFKSLSDTALPEHEFFPETKVHTNYGADLTTLPQSAIPYASQEHRLRSNHLAQTLQLFGHKVSEILPPGYSVQVDLSTMGGDACGDFIYLIHQGADGNAQSILERSYQPFDGGGIGWMLPSDEARNTVLHLEERLFYYKTFLAIKKAVEHRTAATR